MAVLSSSSRCTSPCSDRCSSNSSLTVVPDEVLQLILRRFGNAWDFVRFGSVCRTLHLVEKNCSYNGFPLMAIQHHVWSDVKPVECYSLRINYYPSSTRTSSAEKKPLFVPRVHKNVFERRERMSLVGSSNGWLLLYPGAGFSGPNPLIVLLDPLSGHQSPLPYAFVSIRKMILSSSPSNSLSCHNNNNIIAVALRSTAPTAFHSLAFARLGVNSASIGQWTLFEFWNKSPRYQDIIFWNELLYAITWSGSLVAFDLNNTATPEPRPIRVATFSNPHEKDKHFPSHKFLAKLDGDLLLVCIFWGMKLEEFRALQIYKLDKSSSSASTSTSTSTWTQIHSLDGGALFIGQGSDSISRLVFSNDPYYCIKKNCVYFLRQVIPAIYVFNLEEGSVTCQRLNFIPNGSSHLFWLDLIRC